MKLSMKKVLFLGLLVTGMLSCRKVLDVNPGTELTSAQMYRNVYDANAAVMGIYGKFMSLSDRYILLNELRADLMEYTPNADEYIRQISTHTVTPDNPYTNPRPFYELILNCNDVLKNFQRMKEEKTLTETEYNQRYSDIGSLRSFLYLQLGIHYGEIPYVTESLENITDINNPTRFPKVKLEDGSLLDTLIRFTEALPFKDNYPADVSNGVGTSLNITLDQYQTIKFFINKNVLLGDLHLWKGNYRTAATYYRKVMEEATVGTQGENYYSQYKLGWSGGANYYVTYTRSGDASTLDYSNGWGTMFSASGDPFTREMIWALPYDSKFKPENPLIQLFSPIGGKYLVKPSQEAFDNWNNQQQRPVAVAGASTGIPYDARGLLSTRTIGGQPVITKFIANYIDVTTGLPTNILTKNGKWFLFRQAHLHLRYAEAANRDGFPRLAWALFNRGIPAEYDVAGVSDKTNIMNTFMYPDPYQFDARNGEIPRYRGNWYRNTGIRGRANVAYYPVNATNATDSIPQIELGLLEEGALETAFEGTRWADLLRVAIRRNDPTIISEKIYRKLLNSGMSAGYAAQARDKINNRDWYLPFKLQ